MRTIFLDEFTSLAIVVWVCLLVTTLGDLFTRTDLCVWKKVMWALVVLIVPLGAFAYMAVQSRAITDRKGSGLSPSGSDLRTAAPLSISEEIAEADRLVPMIQQAIEISGILEAEHSLSVMDELDQISMGEQRAGSEQYCGGASDRNSPGANDNQKSPAVAA